MIWVILAVGLIYRLISLNQSLWLDEAIAATSARSFSFWQLVTEFPKFDLHPPGHYLLLKLWGELFGWSEISLRMPSVLIGVATIYVIFLVGRQLGQVRVGLLAAWLLAINPLHLYYSQEARMYGLATFLVLLNFYYFQKLLKSGFSWGYLVTALLVLTTDYVAYFSFVAQAVIVGWWYRDRLKVWLMSLVPSGLLFGLWSPIFLTQLQSGTGLASELPVWQKVVGGFAVKALGLTGVKMMLGRISLVNKLAYAGVVGVSGLIYLSVIWRAIWQQWQMVRQVVVMALVPIMVAWIGSLGLPIYIYFRVLFCLPFVILVLAIGLNQWRRWGVILTVAISLISLISGAVYLSQPQFQREDWRSTVQFLEAVQSSDSVVVLESNGDFAPYSYYGGDKLPTVYGLSQIPATQVDLTAKLGAVRRVYLLEYLTDITDPAKLVPAEISRLGFIPGRIDNFNGVGLVREYQR